MPYKLNNTSETRLITVQDATVDNSTSLTFLGKNYTGYGPAVEENFLHLLENFASGQTNNIYSPSSPLLSSEQGKPIPGQLWFNTDSKQLNITPNGEIWKGIASLVVTTPSVGNTSLTKAVGDMAWDGAYLTVWNGTSDTQIGPYLSTDLGSVSFNLIDNSVSEPSSPTGFQQINGGIFRLYNGSTRVPIAIYSDSPNYTPVSPNPAAPTVPDAPIDPINFPVIQRGITLKGANSDGSSFTGDLSSSYLLWGTAAESLTARNVTLLPNISSEVGYVPFSGITTIGTTLTTSTSFTYNPTTGVLGATATSAFYADLAERYAADAVYEVGTVLVIGGEKEVTVTDKFADTRVVGIVSNQPAYLMNADAGNDETHPAIALKGRVPCKVIGPIKKGDLLVTSAHPGYATTANSVETGALIGKALENKSEGFGVIEVLVV